MRTQMDELDDLTKISPAKKIEEQKIHDVLLLLENLSSREEASIKLIIDCLYDIGHVNLINQKFRSRTLNKSLKLIARLSKPAFKVIAWKWYKSNCPQLIVNWLRKQVAFKPATTVKQAAEIEAGLEPEPKQPIHPTSVIKLESQNREVKHLRSQVRMLASLLVAVTAVFGGTVVWFGYSLERYNLQTVEQLNNRIRVLETSTDEPLATGKEN
ncbi:hypothetical protein Riv7116_2075 [Rivularia sp. PCC 7116]|uniref:hypothetical protein n=1 Tax=Rivularia sp. PCC 7116 TaxID=373994 RepID=UPI00029EED57|nr:hypothetical protein [Rivularia sp. PCC 7116]AFY54607.1 hypothetical protein Riv7116_2075 [Rivularia sp. PCC 7116]